MAEYEKVKGYTTKRRAYKTKVHSYKRKKRRLLPRMK